MSPELDAGHVAKESVLAKTNGTPETPVKISITLPTNAYFMSGIRDFTMTVVQNMTGFSKQWAFRFQSVVDELTNNAIEFGSAPGKDIKVTFVSYKGRQIEVFVQDTGTGAQKKTADEMMALINERRKMDPTQITSIRGRGLAQIVASWTDQLEYKDNPEGGLTVHAVKVLRPEDQA